MNGLLVHKPGTSPFAHQTQSLPVFHAKHTAHKRGSLDELPEQQALVPHNSQRFFSQLQRLDRMESCEKMRKPIQLNARHVKTSKTPDSDRT